MNHAVARVPVVREPHAVHRASPLRRLFEPFWVIPALVTIAAVALGFVLPLLDAALHHQIGVAFPGGPAGARSVLGTIASAMISVTGLVFSITMVVMQLASSQFSPRILQDFLSTRITQWTLGVFVASFVYALTVLREVRGAADDAEAFVPQLSVSLAYLLVLTAFILFLAFIRTIMSLIQVSQVVSRVGDATCAAVAEYFPDEDTLPEQADWEPRGTPSLVRVGDRHGHVVEVDEQRLTALAHEKDLHLDLLPAPGAFLAPGTPLARVWGEVTDDVRDAVEEAVVLAAERRTTHDPGFGVRQLVDVAERALSPGINDPTTAAQVVFELRRVLGTAVRRHDRPRHVADEDGVARLRIRPATVAELLSLGVEEIAHYGAGGVQIPRRLATLLDELEDVTLDRHRTALERTRALVTRRLEDA